MATYGVAFSLFVNIEHAKRAKVDDRFPNKPGLRVIRFVDGHIGRPIGWSHVQKGDPKLSLSWNKHMRERTQIHAYWSDDMWGPWPDVGGKLAQREWQPVQVTTGYAVNAWSEARAAKKAWEMLLAGDRQFLEWNDATSDKRWTGFFHPWLSTAAS